MIPHKVHEVPANSKSTAKYTNNCEKSYQAVNICINLFSHVALENSDQSTFVLGAKDLISHGFFWSTLIQIYPARLLTFALLSFEGLWYI